MPSGKSAAPKYSLPPEPLETASSQAPQKALAHSLFMMPAWQGIEPLIPGSSSPPGIFHGRPTLASPAVHCNKCRLVQFWIDLVKRAAVSWGSQEQL